MASFDLGNLSMATVRKTSDPAPHPTRDEILRAFNLGVRKAMIEHKRADLPIVVWEDGKIKHIPADEIVIPDEPISNRD